MGMNVASGGGKSVQSEINITPFIDIVLVLLIIYMAALPVLMVKTPIDIPRKLDKDSETIPTDTKQFVLTVKGDTSIVFNDGEKDTPLRATEIVRTLKPLLDQVVGDKVVFVDFDDGLLWADAIAVMDSIRSMASDSGEGGQKNEIKVALKVPDPNAAGADAAATP